MVPERRWGTRALERVRAVAAARRGQAIYGALMALGAIASFLQTNVAGAVLDKPSFGTYSAIALWVRYLTPILAFGVLDGIARRLPLQIGAGHLDDANRVRDEALWTLVALGACELAVGWTFARNLGARVGIDPTLIRIGCVAAVGMSLYLFALRDLRSRGKTMAFALGSVTVSGGALLVAWFVGPLGGAPGMLSSETALWTGAAAAMLMIASTRPRLRLPTGETIVPLLREGAVIMMANLMVSGAMVGDRLVLGATADKSVFAVYAWHMIPASAGVVLLNIVDQYISPELLRWYGAHRDDTGLLRRLDKLSGTMAGVGVGCVGGLALALATVAPRVFPQYQFDWRLSALFVVGAVFEMSNVFSVAFIASGRLGARAWLYAGVLLAEATALLTAHLAAASLTTFAATYCGSRVLLFVAARIMAGRGARPPAFDTPARSS